MQILVANESSSNVWFDHLAITHQESMIVQENHYDPFGLNLSGIEREGNYPYQFNSGSEKQKDVTGNGYFYETDFRGYDPQLGRFRGIDLLGDMVPGITPYQFSYNNPIMGSDPSGLVVLPVVVIVGQSITGAAIQTAGVVLASPIGAPLLAGAATLGGVGGTGGGCCGGQGTQNPEYRSPAQGAQTAPPDATGIAKPRIELNQYGRVGDVPTVKAKQISWLEKWAANDPIVYPSLDALYVVGNAINPLSPKNTETHIDGAPVESGERVNALASVVMQRIMGKALSGSASSTSLSVASGGGGGTAARTALTNGQLVQKAATKAERAIGGTGRFAGTAKHEYATNLLIRYQQMYGQRGLQFKVYFDNTNTLGAGNKGFLDVLDNLNGMIYDWKFGYPNMTLAQLNLTPQMAKYRFNFGLPSTVIKP